MNFFREQTKFSSPGEDPLLYWKRRYSQLQQTTVDPGKEIGLARERAIEGAAKRFSFKQTVATSPLGIQGPGAQLGKKRLLGV